MEFDIQHIRVSKKCVFSRCSYNLYKNSWKEGDELCWGHQGSNPVHISTQTDVSWVGAQPVTRKQRPAVTVTSRPVPSVSRSVGTTTRVVDVKHVVPPKSSPPKKDTKSSKPSSPKVSPVHESDATILLLKHTREN